MKLLVTGGAGFIGSNFVRHILNKYHDYRIMNLDKLTYAGSAETLHDFINSDRHSFVKGDICDRGLLSEIVRDIDCIINFAAETHVDRSILGDAPFVRTNIVGTHELLEVARQSGVRLFLQISTDEVYGSIDKGSFSETSNLSPNSPYASSKASADLIALSYFRTHGLPVIITRSSNNFGPYQYPEKLIPLFIINALHNKYLPLYGDGNNTREWLYVEDNCRAIDILMHKGIPGEVYNIGSGYERKNIEVAELMLDMMGITRGLIKNVEDRPAHDRRYSLDFTKIGNLGYEPLHSFEDSFKKTIKWYTDNREWWGKLMSGEFKNYYRTQYGHRFEQS